MVLKNTLSTHFFSNEVSKFYFARSYHLSAYQVNQLNVNGAQAKENDAEKKARWEPAGGRGGCGVPQYSGGIQMLHREV